MSAATASRLRHVDRVAALQLDDGRAARFDISALRGGRNHLVVGRHQVPARLASSMPVRVTAPFSASTPHGTCESAMNAAVFASTSAANAAANFALSRNRKPSCGGRIGGTGAPGGGSLMSDATPTRPCQARTRQCRQPFFCCGYWPGWIPHEVQHPVKRSRSRGICQAP